jgi:hypothetical protein
MAAVVASLRPASQDKQAAVDSQVAYADVVLVTKSEIAGDHDTDAAVATGAARVIGESPYFTIVVQVHVLRRVVAVAATPADSVLTLAMGSTQAMSVRALAEDSTVVAEAPLRWTLPDTAIARFDTATKTLRAVRMGETRLAVSAPFGRDSYTTRTWRIRVVAGGLAVSRTRLGLGVGERAPLTVQLLDDRRQPIGPATHLTWTSSADSIARFADGAVQGLKIGRARLTARRRVEPPPPRSNELCQSRPRLCHSRFSRCGPRGRRPSRGLPPGFFGALRRVEGRRPRRL